MSHDQEPEAPGWDAINSALEKFYGNVEPLHWGTVLPYQLGGDDPLVGISAYVDPQEGSWWHYVTYGFSELWEKESEDLDVSGFGFELTFRLKRQRNEEPPNWPLNFLQNLGRYVFETGRTFGVGHTMPLNSPIAIGVDTPIRAVAFAADPQLPPIDSPNGRVEFLMIFGLTDDELAAVQRWDAEAFLQVVAQRNPLLITDIRRKSLLTDPKFAAEVERRTAAEGASCGMVGTDEFRFRAARDASNCELTLSAFLIDDLKLRLAGRLPFGRSFTIAGETNEVVFEPADSSRWQIDDGILTIRLAPEALQELEAALVPKAGEYALPGFPALKLVIEKTEIKDQNGNVVDVIG